MSEEKEELHALARAVTLHLAGFSYDAEACSRDGELCWFATLRDPERGLVELQSNGKGRLVVHGSCSDLPSFRHSSGIRRPSITVDAGRPLAQIARDIERRLLPELAEVRVRAKAHVAETQAYDAGMAAAKRHLTAHERGHEYSENNLTLHDVPGYGYARIDSPDTVRLELRVPPAVAAMLVDAARAVKLRAEGKLREAAECELRTERFLEDIEPGAFAS